MNTSLFICNDTLNLFDRPTFKCLLVIEFLVGIFAVITNIFLFISLFKTRLFHNNLRILLINMCLASFGYSISMTVKIVYIFIQYVFDPCRLVVSLYDCKLSEIFVILPMLGMMYSLVPVGLERAYATINYRNYERSKCVCLSLTLITFMWIVSLVIQLKPLVSISKLSMTPFCVNILILTNTTAIVMLTIGIVQECVALGFYLLTYFVNKTLYTKLLINRASIDQTLSSRFQLAQNIQISELMLPTAAVHAALILPTNILAALVVCGLEFEFALRVELVHAAYLAALVYAAINPVICFTQNVALRRAMLSCMRRKKENLSPEGMMQMNSDNGNDGRDCGRVGRCSGISANIRSDQHFDMLTRSWQKP